MIDGGQSIPDDALIKGVRVGSWRRLCDVADQFRQLAPWEWVTEDEIFGIRIPGSDRIGFVSILGQAGEHYACVVYDGWEALRDLRASLAEGTFGFRRFLEIPQMQLAMEGRNALLSIEREILRSIGRTYRGPSAWPVFRSHHVGYLPWPVNQQEADALAHVVYQAMGIAMRKEDDPRLLESPEPGALFVRGQESDGRWVEEWLTPPAANDRHVTVSLDAALIERVVAGGVATGCLQVDLPLSTAVIGKRGERPQTAYLLVAAERESGQCVMAEMVQALDGLAQMWASIPGKMLELFDRMGGYPAEVEVASERMMSVWRPLIEHVPIKLTRRERLNRVDEIRASLDRFFAERPDEEERS